MIFAALVLLSVYLPTRATLQRATQFAATAVATEISDTWITIDMNAPLNNIHKRYSHRKDLENVYALIFGNRDGMFKDKAEQIAQRVFDNSLRARIGTPEMKCHIVNRGVYKEVVVVGEHLLPIGNYVDLSFIGFPTELVITVSSSAIVADGDEFVRNVDLIASRTDGLIEKIIDTFNKVDMFITRFGIGW